MFFYFDRCEVVLPSKEDPNKQEIYDLVKGTDAILWWWSPYTMVDKDLMDAAGKFLHQNI